MTQPLDPTLLNPGSDASVPFDQFTATYDDAIRNADSQVTSAQGRYQQALSVVQGIPPPKASGLDLNDESRKTAQAELAKAATVVEQASQAASAARERKGAAIERYSQRGNIPVELRDRYAAMAQVERSTAAQKQAEVAEFLNTAPNRREEVRAHTQEAVANAQVAQAKADLASATTDIQKQAAQTAYDQAVANLGRTQIDNKTAGYTSQITAAQAAVAPDIAQAQASKAKSEATVAAAGAAVAPQQAQASVDQAQANVNKTNQEIADLQRQARQAPTDAQAQQAIQTQIAQKQVELESAQQQLKQAQQLLPGVVAQQGATLAGTEANTAATLAGTQKGLLGNLYGLQDKAKQIADMIRSGQITDPADGMAQLQNYIRTTIAGTTPFEAGKTALETETTRRGQDYTMAGQQMSALGSFGSSALGNMLSVNKDAPAGSDAMARSYGGVMGAMMGAFQGMRPQEQMNSPLLQSMSSLAGVSSPTTTIAPDGTVTIQHTGAATAPTPAATTPDLMGAGSPSAAPPAFLTGNTPAMPQHVEDLWANDPNLNPGNAVATRTAYGATNRGM